MATKHPTIFILESIDRCGKSTLVNNIQRYLGAHTVVHSGRPPVLELFNVPIDPRDVADDMMTGDQRMQANYQHAYFKNAFKIIAQNRTSPMIFDRLHLGEMVYSPLYRNVIPNSVMAEERYILGGGSSKHVRLILLTEDFSKSKHFVSDGESFDDSAREEEQRAFLKAYHSSCITDKRIINVTGADGNFKPELEILLEALI